MRLLFRQVRAHRPSDLVSGAQRRYAYTRGRRESYEPCPRPQPVHPSNSLCYVPEMEYPTANSRSEAETGEANNFQFSNEDYATPHWEVY